MKYMKRENILQAIRLGELIGEKESAYVKTEAYMQLRKQSRALSAIDTHYCNGTRYAETEDAHEKACEKVYKKIENTTRALGLNYYHQSDPRGAALYVSTRTINSNSYSNELAIF